MPEYRSLNNGTLVGQVARRLTQLHIYIYIYICIYIYVYITNCRKDLELLT